MFKNIFFEGFLGNYDLEKYESSKINMQINHEN